MLDVLYAGMLIYWRCYILEMIYFGDAYMLEILYVRDTICWKYYILEMLYVGETYTLVIENMYVSDA